MTPRRPHLTRLLTFLVAMLLSNVRISALRLISTSSCRAFVKYGSYSFRAKGFNPARHHRYFAVMSSSNANNQQEVTAATQTIPTTDQTAVQDRKYTIFEGSSDQIESEDTIQEVQTFASLGLSPAVIEALNSAGFERPTAIQSRALQAVFSGRDVVIGAETGSGKTLAYLLPVLEMTLQDPERDDTARSRFPSTVVLVPNNHLCQQVVDMGRRVIPEYSGLTIDTVRGVHDSWPFSSSSCPDVLVCTPTFLASFTKPSAAPRDREQSVFGSMRRLVLDEADMLFEGSYLSSVDRVLDVLRLVRRDLIRDGELKLHQVYVQTILAAATIPTYGKRSIANMIKKKVPNAVYVRTPVMHQHHPAITHRYIKLERNEADWRAAESGQLDPKDSVRTLWTEERIAQLAQAIRQPPPANDPSTVDEGEGDGAADSAPRKPVKRSTMVFLNTARAAEYVAARLREPPISLPCIEFHNLLMPEEKSENMRRFQLFGQSSSPPKLSDDRVSSSQHRGAEEREVDGEAEGTEDLAAGVLVCTDSIARGLDLSHVGHVVQAEFALNVVQHMHRVGRASRAGKAGRATNFYDVAAEDLVKRIRGEGRLSRTEDGEGSDGSSQGGRGIQGEGAGQGEETVEVGRRENARRGDIDDSFSRRRGLRKKIRKGK